MAPAAVNPVIAAALEAGAESVVVVARFNINDGAVSGAGHVSGPVGGYPNSDTHELAASLHRGDTIETPGQIKSSAIADAPYAAFVHNGTSRAGPRPFMMLTVEALRLKILRDLRTRFFAQIGSK
jgi:hypothetical protein